MGGYQIISQLDTQLSLFYYSANYRTGGDLYSYQQYIYLPIRIIDWLVSLEQLVY